MARLTEEAADAPPGVKGSRGRGSTVNPVTARTATDPGPRYGASTPAGYALPPTNATEHAVFVSDLDDDSPARQLRLGFDPAGRLLEVVVLRFDSGNEFVSTP